MSSTRIIPRRVQRHREPVVVVVPDPVQRRVPIEVWVKIFSYLYPSQLSRIATTSKEFSEIVSSLKVWSRMFSVAHGDKAHLRSLVCIPRFKSSYMLFMCASSLHVCEKCFGLAKFNTGELYKLPLPIPVLLPRRSIEGIKYVGDKFDPNWTIRMCLPCRQSHLSALEEPTPRHITQDRMDWLTLCQKHPSAERTLGLRGLLQINNNTFTESDAFDSMRHYFGGDIGIQNFKSSTYAYDEKTETRTRWYQLQD